MTVTADYTLVRRDRLLIRRRTEKVLLFNAVLPIPPLSPLSSGLQLSLSTNRGVNEGKIPCLWLRNPLRNHLLFSGCTDLLHIGVPGALTLKRTANVSFSPRLQSLLRVDEKTPTLDI